MNLGNEPLVDEEPEDEEELESQEPEGEGDDLDNLEDAELEKRARARGWRPESEWDPKKGGPKPKVFLTAREFLERGPESASVLREEKRALERRLDQQTQTINELNTRIGELGKMVEWEMKQSVENGKRAYERAKRELEASRKAAVEEGDTAKFDAAEEGLKQLEASKPPAPPLPTKPREPPAGGPEPVRPARRDQPQYEASGKPIVGNDKPELHAFIERNPWFWKDNVLNAAAIAVQTELREEDPDLSEGEHYAELERRVKERYPAKFGENPRRRAPSAALRPSAPGRRTSGRRFEDLPPDDKAAYERQRDWMAAKGEPFTKEEFLERYQW